MLGNRANNNNNNLRLGHNRQTANNQQRQQKRFCVWRYLIVVTFCLHLSRYCSNNVKSPLCGTDKRISDPDSQTSLVFVSESILSPVLQLTLSQNDFPGYLNQTLAHRTAPSSPSPSPSLSYTNTHAWTQTANSPPEPRVCVSLSVCLSECVCLSLTGIWVHAAVRRCVRTWWSTTSWLLWQRCSERWDAASALLLPSSCCRHILSTWGLFF